MSKQLDISQLPQEVVTGGVLFGSPHDLLVAVPDRGTRRVFRNDGKLHPKSVHRNAENYLRRVACLEPLPKFCTHCGADVPTSTTDFYCSNPCRREARGKKPTVGGFDWDLLTLDEQAQKLAALRAKWDADHFDDGESVPVPTKLWHASTSSGRDLHAGLLLAERLIRDKGGIVPVREKFDDYLARFEAGQAVSETA